MDDLSAQCSNKSSGDNTKCICSFDTDFITTHTKECIYGMKDRGYHKCYNLTPCSEDTQCFTESCNTTTTSTISYYRFTKRVGDIKDNINTRANSNVELLSFNGPPTSDTKAMKVTSLDDGTDDIYVLTGTGVYMANVKISDSPTGDDAVTWDLVVSDTSIVDITLGDTLYYLKHDDDSGEYVIYRYADGTSTPWPLNTDGVPKDSTYASYNNITKLDISPDNSTMAIVTNNFIKVSSDNTTNYVDISNAGPLSATDIRYAYNNTSSGERTSLFYYTRNQKGQNSIKMIGGPGAEQRVLAYIFGDESLSSYDIYKEASEPYRQIAAGTPDGGTHYAIYVKYDRLHNMFYPIDYAPSKDTIVAVSLNSYYLLDKHSCTA